MQTICKNEIEHEARERFGYPAKITPFTVRDGGTAESWYMLELLLSTGAKRIIGCRRELSELVGLVRRGPAMGIINGDSRSNPQADQSRVPQDTANVVPG